MVDDICDQYTQGFRLPEFGVLPDVFKEIEIESCEYFCPDHACSIADQDWDFNRLYDQQKLLQ